MISFLDIREYVTGITPVFYLITVLMFIFGLKLMRSPKTARKGNLLSALGMLIAIAVTLLDKNIVSYKMIFFIFVAGSIVGAFLSYTVKMTAVPQFVAVLNAFGGAVSAIVGVAEFMSFFGDGHVPEGVTPVQFFSAVSADAFIGTLTFSGSMIAFAKLQGIISEKAIHFKGKAILNILFLSGSVFLGWKLVSSCVSASAQGNIYSLYYLFGIVILALLLGLSLTLAVGGADMPIIIALFIAYAGLSASALGFTTMNYGLIMVGSLVGASGMILTKIMAGAINRDFWGILLGNITPPEKKGTAEGDFYSGKIKSTSSDETAMLLEAADTVVIIPGYGMAVAQAQGACRDLYSELISDGKEVYFAVHPVAGRMPGHMNVLLAEVDIPYDRLKELDESNELLNGADIAIVLGANDVVNPMARSEKGTPIYGMPILNADRARTVIIIKRSLSPGFSGIPNPLFILDNSLLYFKDAKPALQEILKSYKEQKN